MIRKIQIDKSMQSATLHDGLGQVPVEIEEFILSYLCPYSTLYRLVCKRWSLCIPKLYVPKSIAIQAVKDDLYPVIEKLMLLYPDHFGPKVLRVLTGMAAEAGNINTLGWLVSGVNTISSHQLRLAAQANPDGVVTWYKNAKMAVPSEVYVGAARAGQVEILRHLDSNQTYPDEQFRRIAAVKAARSGDIETLRYTMSRVTSTRMCYHIAKGEICASTKCHQSISSLSGAAASGNLEMVKWVVKHDATCLSISRTDHAVLKAARRGYTDIISYLLGSTTYRVHLNVWRAAIRGNHVQVLDLLTQHYQSKNLAKPHLNCEYAAQYSSYESMLFIENHGFSPGSIPIVAAKRGDIQIFKWCVDRSKFSLAIHIHIYLAAAAEHDHLHFLKWYVEEYKGKCRTASVATGAAKGGSVRCFIYCRKNNFKVDKAKCIEAINKRNIVRGRMYEKSKLDDSTTPGHEYIRNYLNEYY